MGKIIRVDEDTGEIKTEPPFVKAYVGHLAKMKGLPPMQTEVLYFLLCSMNYDNTVAIPRKKKLKFIADHKTTSQTFSNCISKLALVGFIDIEDVSQYFINPDYFTKSDWTKTKRLVAKWTFSEDGVSFERDIIDDDGTVLIEAEEKGPSKAVKQVAELIAKPKILEVEFESFWNIYPKKTKKKECEKIWGKLKLNAEQFGVIAGHLQIAYVSTDKKFIPNPSSYLNGELWNDEVITDAPKLGFDSDIPSWKRQPGQSTDPFSGNTFEGELN